MRGSAFGFTRAFGAMGVFGVRIGRVMVVVMIVIMAVVVMMVVVVLRHQTAHACAKRIAVGAIGHV